MPGRHDPKNAGTPSEIPSTYASTTQSSIFSRDPRDSRSLSTLSDATLTPSDSASQVQYSYGPGGKGPPPKPGPGQPKPDSYQTQFSNLSISDNNKPNQSAQRQQTTSKDRHAPNPKEDNKSSARPAAKSSNRKDQLYDDTYH